MDTVIPWCGFLGAWLVVAASVYQAALELAEENVGRDQVTAASRRVAEPDPVSPWWWLVPPVRYLLERRRVREYRRAVMQAMTAEELAGAVQYINKAAGWLMVAGGGFLLATKETWELAEREEWPQAGFWVLVVAMAAVAAGWTVLRLAWSRRVLERT